MTVVATQPRAELSTFTGQTRERRRQRACSLHSWHRVLISTDSDKEGSARDLRATFMLSEHQVKAICSEAVRKLDVEFGGEQCVAV